MGAEGSMFVSKVIYLEAFWNFHTQFGGKQTGDVVMDTEGYGYQRLIFSEIWV